MGRVRLEPKIRLIWAEKCIFFTTATRPHGDRPALRRGGRVL